MKKARPRFARPVFCVFRLCPEQARSKPPNAKNPGFAGALFICRGGGITTTPRKSLCISKLQERISAGSPFSSQFIRTGLSAFGELRNLCKYTKKPTFWVQIVAKSAKIYWQRVIDFSAV